MIRFDIDVLDNNLLKICKMFNKFKNNYSNSIFVYILKKTIFIVP